MAAWAFCLSIALLAYVYGGFAFVLIVAGRIRNRTVRRAPITPRVSLVIAAYNEERHIGERLENALALDYPASQLEIIVASDGSTDRTEAIVQASSRSKSIKLLKLPRRGKLYALDSAVKQATGEILVFSDANSMFARGAVRELAECFADPEIGGVAGRTRYDLKAESDSSSQGENLYWSFDGWLKEMESRTGSIVSAHGGIYAIRRELYNTAGALGVTDDFAISTGVIEQGYRLVYAHRAVSYEAAAPAAEREFRRKTRLMTRGLRGVLLRRRLLNPFHYGFYSVILLSHKVLRRLVALLLAPLFIASLALASTSVVYSAVAAAQTSFYALALAGYVLRRTDAGRLKPLFIPFFYCMANAAALVAIANLIRGHRIELWQPQRENEPEAAA